MVSVTVLVKNMANFGFGHDIGPKPVKWFWSYIHTLLPACMLYVMFRYYVIVIRPQIV